MRKMDFAYRIHHTFRYLLFVTLLKVKFNMLFTVNYLLYSLDTQKEGKLLKLCYEVLLMICFSCSHSIVKMLLQPMRLPSTTVK